MAQVNHLYETTFIVNASLEDTQVETTIAHVQDIVTRNAGEIKAVNKWGRKRLAYTIQKKNNGFYVNIEFEGPGSIVGHLERAYGLDENVLRFLTTQIGKKALKARLQPPPQAAVPQEAEPAAKDPVPQVKTPIFDDEITEPKK